MEEELTQESDYNAGYRIGYRAGFDECAEAEVEMQQLSLNQQIRVAALSAANLFAKAGDVYLGGKEGFVIKLAVNFETYIRTGVIEWTTKKK